MLFLVASLACTLVYFTTPALTLWLHQTIEQIAVSFLALAVLSAFMVPVIARTRRFDRKVAVPNAIKAIALIGFVVSTIGFAIFGYVTATSHYNSWSRSFLVSYYSTFPIGTFFFGVVGFAFFVSASLCLLAYFLEKGKMGAFKETLLFFVFPALIIYELWLSLADPVEMPIHVTMFLSSTPLAGILTNWFIFVVSSGLFVLGLAHKKLGF
jgi:hypothetical protein